jgi:hypothetical protein
MAQMQSTQCPQCILSCEINMELNKIKSTGLFESSESGFLLTWVTGVECQATSTQNVLFPEDKQNTAHCNVIWTKFYAIFL